jgi:hypothetical protein
VLYLSTLLLSRLKDKRIDEYDRLRTFSRDKIAGGDALFVPALSFLYLMGVIDYRPKTDAIEYVGPQ